ncbi:hypothetical protein L7F22_034555 [Adiantum nelumboides]|nr:hypothetical protein [Adiantum nelumboides]
MRANRATTEAKPSPTIPNATTCTVPRSSPLLSSSFTPFYPRSQQQYYVWHPGYVNSHEGGCHTAVPRSDDVDTGQSHFPSWSHGRGSNFYDPQYYASLGVEPYDASWVPIAGTVCDGGAWQQWGDPPEFAYAVDDTGDSAKFFSDSLSCYTESPTFEQDISACASSNPTTVPMVLLNKTNQFSKCPVIERSEAYLKTIGSTTGSISLPHLFHSAIMPEQASCASKKLKENTLSSFRDLKDTEVSGYEQGSAKGERKDAANEFIGSKLDLNCSGSQISVPETSDFGSQAGELKSTTDLVGNVHAQKQVHVVSKASSSLSKEHGSADIIDTQCSISATSNIIEHISNLNLSTVTLPLASDVNPKEAQSTKSVSHYDTSFRSTNDKCQNVVKPVSFQALEQVTDLEELHQEKPKSSFIQPEDVGFCSNGPQLLVECIHNLSKVLLSSQSKTSINALNSSDCLVLENTICMLSYRLFQCSAIEANSCSGPSCQQEQKTSNDSVKVFAQPGSLHNASNQVANMKHSLSFQKSSQHGALQNASQFTAASSGGGDQQNLSLLNHLQVTEEERRLLRCQLQELQAELGYERAESNATVSIYKDLWSEAQEALRVSRSEIKVIRAELDGLKQELTNLKLSGRGVREREVANDVSKATLKPEEISKTVTISSQGVLASDLSRASTEKGDNICSSKDLHALSSYFDLGVHSNCRNTGVSFTKCENIDSKYSDQKTPARHSSKSRESFTRKSSVKHTIASPLNLENDVAQRLSLLLSRQGLDLNKTCTESCMEQSSGSPTIFDSSFDVSGEDMAVPPNNSYLVWSETSYLVNDDSGSGYAVSNFDCQRKHDFEKEYNCLYGVPQSESNNGGMNAVELREGVSQEDEIEIICLKPGISDSNSTSLKEESDWEDVVVNALDVVKCKQ